MKNLLAFIVLSISLMSCSVTKDEYKDSRQVLKKPSEEGSFKAGFGIYIINLQNTDTCK